MLLLWAAVSVLSLSSPLTQLSSFQFNNQTWTVVYKSICRKPSTYTGCAPFSSSHTDQQSSILSLSFYLPLACHHLLNIKILCYSTAHTHLIFNSEGLSRCLINAAVWQGGKKILQLIAAAAADLFFLLFSSKHLQCQILPVPRHIFAEFTSWDGINGQSPVRGLRRRDTQQKAIILSRCMIV